MGPALDRRPATEAVLMMEPLGLGLFCSMALAACLVARKTLFGSG